MAVIGILARIDRSRYNFLWDDLQEKQGTTPFPIEDETARIGILIEGSTASETYQILDSLQKSKDIYGLWPVYEHLEEESISIDSQQIFEHVPKEVKDSNLEEMPS